MEVNEQFLGQAGFCSHFQRGLLWPGYFYSTFTALLSILGKGRGSSRSLDPVKPHVFLFTIIDSRVASVCLYESGATYSVSDAGTHRHDMKADRSELRRW